jgi:putative endonuclease
MEGLIPGCYTDSRRPVKLVFSEQYERIDEAIAAERRIKGWSRAKKEAYMRGDFRALIELAKRGSEETTNVRPDDRPRLLDPSFETRCCESLLRTRFSVRPNATPSS